MKKYSLFIIFSILCFTSSFAQVNENFADGEFSINPTWSGDAASFTVINEQLRSNNQNTNSSYYLSTPNTLAMDAQWEIWVNLQFATSGSNYVDVYLTSDVPNISTPNNGYFVRIGNTSDDISLYKSEAGVATILIDGINQSVASSSNNLIKLKVTRDQSGLWNLKRDITGIGTSMVSEGTVLDNTFTTSNFFGIYLKQSTASFFLKHFFDDVLVQPLIVDTQGPSIASISLVNPSSIDVLFSEPLEINSAQNIANYSVLPAGLSIQSATLDATTTSLVHLDFSGPLSSATDYQFVFSNITDEANNILVGSPVTVNFYIAGLFELVINELMPDPDPPIALPNAEYLELYNRSTHQLNTRNYFIVFGNTIKSLPEFVLNPNEYLIVTSTSNATLFSGNVITIDNLSTSSLTNTGMTVVLKNSLNETIHQVSYTDQWYADANKASGGWSLEQKDPNNPCAGSGNWAASNSINGGTPGSVNSVLTSNPDNTIPKIICASPINNSSIQLYFSEPILTNNLNNTSLFTVNNGFGNPSAISISGSFSDNIILDFPNAFDAATVYNVSLSVPFSDCSGNQSISIVSPDFSIYSPAFFEVVFNELMADPDPSQGLPNAEYVEFFNKTNFPISTRNWKFKYGSTIKDIEYGTIPANGYALLTAPSAVETYQQFYSVLKCSSISNSGFLTNSGTELNLLDSLDNLKSTLTYSDAWYKDNSKIGGGWSLEQIDPNNPCGGSKNWKASTSNSGGTPGNLNSVNAQNPDAIAPKISSVCINGNALKVNFSEFVKNELLNNLSSFTVNNGLGNPISVVFGSDVISNSADLFFDQSFISDLIYTLTLNVQLTDCIGNLSSLNSTFNFSNRIPKEYEIVINELMPDPDPSQALPSAEYIELFNKTAVPFSLKDFSLQSGNSSSTIGCVSIAANGYLLLNSEPNVEVMSEYGTSSGLTSFSLSNDGSIVALRTPQGKIISSVEYDINWYKSSAKNSGGWSLEQIDPNNPCAGMDNWSASNNLNGGTPGAINSINAYNPDVENPIALRAYPMSSNILRITFNETLNSNVSNSNFNVDNGIGSPITTTAIAPLFNSVLLEFDHDFVLGTIYTLSFSNPISDCVGNLFSDKKTIKFGIPTLPQIGDISITEILADPKTGGNDFVEIYNHSSKIIDLKTCRISNYDTTTMALSSVYPIDSTGFLIFPNQYYAMSKSAQKLTDFYTVPYEENLINCENFPGLSITEGTVAISLWDETIIDKAYYNQQMQFPLLNDTKGVSLEKINLELPSKQYSNWTSASESVGFATPTYKNSQDLSSKLDQNTLVFSSDIFSPDNDGYQDVVEITYNLEKANLVGTLEVYDSKGRMVKKLFENQLMGLKGSIIWNGIDDDNEKSNIGIYQVYLNVFDLNGKSKSYKKVLVVAGRI